MPTAKTNKCGLDTATGAAVTTNRQQTRVIEASQDAIVNNMLAYFIVAGAVLLILIAVGAVAHVRNRTAATSGVPRGEETCASITEHPRAYWSPIAAASALWVAGFWKFANDREWFFDHAHGWSATVMFIFIVCVVVTVALQKHHGIKEAKEPRSLRWAWTYWAIAVLMVVGAVAIFVETMNGSDGFATHRVFWLEAWMILGSASSGSSKPSTVGTRGRLPEPRKTGGWSLLGHRRPVESRDVVYDVHGLGVELCCVLRAACCVETLPQCRLRDLETTHGGVDEWPPSPRPRHHGPHPPCVMARWVSTSGSSARADECVDVLELAAIMGQP